MAETTAVVAVPVVVANASKLASAGRNTLTALKAVGSAAAAGVVMGTGLGVTIVAAGATAMGILWAAGTAVEKYEQYKMKKSIEATPSPA